MRNSANRLVKIRIDGVELDVVDCMHWNPSGGVPKCILGHDITKCDTCEFKEQRPVFSPKPRSMPHLEAEATVMRGLGDVVAAVTKSVGIQPCGGCAERQAWLNKVVPFGKQEDNGSTSTQG